MTLAILKLGWLETSSTCSLACLLPMCMYCFLMENWDYKIRIQIKIYQLNIFYENEILLNWNKKILNKEDIRIWYGMKNLFIFNLHKKKNLKYKHRNCMNIKFVSIIFKIRN